ncbi:hypothetical protein OJ996_00815 [Luteolibacter sp. GHJ8]|uniref:Uncharacterized protein n=1 Tax=Luteolibacter rhizosphaerae TaxID=2989719 RepID=A0ABT3FWY6_9BACT|nr:hypothetical protein [Luteolibacter rhizosphaerae]MCW1912094.1 hypothetical protein [Luteolibacter rhizosphaerae]
MAVKMLPSSLVALLRGALLLGTLAGISFGQEKPLPAPKAIGAIVEFKDPTAERGKMAVDYSYGADQRLILVIRGVEMNGAAHTNAAKTVGGELAVKGNQIQISPEEIYGPDGAVETIRVYTLRYIVPNVQPGIYRLIHDDSKAEGEDRVIDISLDLKKPGKKTLLVDGKIVPPSPPVIIKQDEI